MIRNLLDAEFVEKQRRILAQRLRTEAQLLEAGKPSSVDAAGKHGVSPKDLATAAEMLEACQVDAGSSLLYLPGDRVASLLQDALDRAYREAGVVRSSKGVSGLSGSPDAIEAVTDESLPDELASAPEVEGLVEFEEGDPRYVTGYLMGKAANLFSRSTPFPDRPARLKIENRTRVILFGDWGSGIPRARSLASTIKARLGPGGHAIHLGDAYFAGFAHEYKERLLPHWPGQKGRSWSIAGNHDMYAGPDGFLQTMLGDPRFEDQRRSPWFVLENDHWQICGLDSAFQPPDASGQKGALAGSQGEQFYKLRKAAPDKAGIVLTHHQPFNVKAGKAEIHSPKMVESLRPAIDEKLIKAWFWGHEHDAAVFAPWETVEYPCLTGHAGVPESYKVRAGNAMERWRWDDHFEGRDGEYFTMGFTVLDFDGDAMEVSFYNENNLLQKFRDGKHILKSR